MDSFIGHAILKKHFEQELHEILTSRMIPSLINDPSISSRFSLDVFSSFDKHSNEITLYLWIVLNTLSMILILFIYFPDLGNCCEDFSNYVLTFGYIHLLIRSTFVTAFRKNGVVIEVIVAISTIAENSSIVNIPRE